MWRVIGMATKDSDRYTVADFGKAQPLFRGSAGLKHGNSIPVSILKMPPRGEVSPAMRCAGRGGTARVSVVLELFPLIQLRTARQPFRMGFLDHALDRRKGY